ncbi:prephenate dehydratase [Apibacter sp. B3889]|uniref:prephenate dehydratase n=1 Tax=unclassified Apibacter TaxID=2630820 RepID=UPI001326F113|nr:MULTISPECIES: prephenate dehydratase [unclassified Apibacter]MXO33740.1 prephenate dehydratase [Apibacter sp. B3883]MXO41097.1 prephenate dehydratase [Apibacter sp. B3889]MXP04266.1 prephenate dehydratase [Apibacter sp. B3887]MXP06923.1 prephenate dehydratase [Apibacter sp. B3935]
MKSISIQGIKGSFHHEAVNRFFQNEKVEIIDSPTFKTVVRDVINGKANYGMMAIENSIAGAILPNYSLITKNGLHIVGEVVLPIKHHLLALPGETLDSISEVRTHPMALLQCENFLEKYPDWKLLSKDDTATCAYNIHSKKMKGIATIGSKLAAEMYQLQVLAENIHDVSDNYTRFYLLSPKTEKVENFTKASLYFTTDHTMGSLAKVLNILANHQMNITKIQSVPLSGSVFQYSFHADIITPGGNDDNYRRALEEIKNNTNFLHILGEYKEDKI